jgi:hypothetical protein
LEEGLAGCSWAEIPFAKVRARRLLTSVGPRILGTAEF